MHEIYQNDRFASRDVPAWHNLGTTFTGPMTATDAVMQAKMQYHVEKVPHEIWCQEILVDTVYDLVRLPNEHDSDPAYFGTVTESYEVINNLNLAAALDPLTKVWPVETVGALKQGESVFFTFKTGEFEIGGDEVRGYFLVHNGHTGKESLKIAFTPVRVVCANTLTMGLKQSQVQIAISHQTGAMDQLDFWTSVLPLMEKAQADSKAIMQRMAEFRLNAAQTEQILMAAYPDPKRGAKARLKEELQDVVIPESMMATIDKASLSNQYYTDRQGGFRAATRELLDVYNQSYALTAETAWAVCNAVVESEDYRRGREPEFSAVFAGDRVRAKERAFREAVAIMEGGK